MKLTTLILLLTTLQLQGAEARKAWQTPFYTRTPQPAFRTCRGIVDAVEFDFKVPKGSKATGRYKYLCLYPPAIGTFLFCVEEVTGKKVDQMEADFKYVNQMCKTYQETPYSWEYYRDQYINATDYVIEVPKERNESLPLYSPSYLEKKKAIKAYKTRYATYKNFDDSTYYGSGLMAYFALIMLLATISNFLTKVGAVQRLSNPLINKFRSYITIPAMYPKGKNAQTWGGWKVFTGLFPDRWDSLVCFGYTIMHIVFWCMPYNAPTKVLLTRRVADRAGIIAFAEVPLLVLFAGRNNFLSFVTGIKFSSFIHYHKCVARFMAIDAIIHGMGYTIYDWDTYAQEFAELYWCAGVVATLLAGLIWLFSFHPIRSRQYEIFLYSHIILALAFLIMCYYHCKKLGWCEFLIAASVVWILDRVIRIARMCTFGYQKAIVEIVSEDTFKLTVNKPKLFQPKPGQFGYVYFADSLLWFQNHPFTILNEGDRLAFYIKHKRGITNKMYQKLISAGGKMTTRVCVEGPYGEHSAVAKYKNALLITAGAGVPGIFEHALSMSQKSNPSKIKFIWIHKSFSDLNYYLNEMLLKLKDTRVVVDLYLTRETGPEGYSSSSNDKTSSSSDDNSEKGKELAIKELPSFINFKYGRPNIEELLHSEIQEFEGGSVGIVACGPPIVMDQLRHSVSKEVDTYKQRIDYFDEFQIW